MLFMFGGEFKKKTILFSIAVENNIYKKTYQLSAFSGRIHTFYIKKKTITLRDYTI